jgi:hypothetical protein
MKNKEGEKNELMKYEVNCIEHGEHFYFVLETDETNKGKVMTQAREDASMWGAEVISIDWNGTKEVV